MNDVDLEADATLPKEPKEKHISVWKKVERWYHGLPDKKRYLEFLTALLTIPVLLTVIIANVRTLKTQEQPVTPTPTSATQPPFGNQPPPNQNEPTLTPTVTNTPSPTPSSQCKKEVGPISIVYPEEGTTVTKDPVCLDIVRTGEDYCAVVWSYRINGGTWSDYTDKSICMYGMPSGTKKVELRVKSIVTGAETLLTRTFTVAGTSTPTPTSTSSANL